MAGAQPVGRLLQQYLTTSADVGASVSSTRCSAAGLCARPTTYATCRTRGSLPALVFSRALHVVTVAALAAVGAAPGVFAYPASKLALARWVRRHAVTEEWIGSGIRLNAIAPGVVASEASKKIISEPGLVG